VVLGAFLLTGPLLASRVDLVRQPLVPLADEHPRVGTSELAQGCTGQLAPVEFARFEVEAPPIRA